MPLLLDRCAPRPLADHSRRLPLRQLARGAAFALALSLPLALAGCGVTDSSPSPDPVEPRRIEAAWVQLIGDERTMVRAIVAPPDRSASPSVDGAMCPPLVADGVAQPMTLRVAPGIAPKRPVVTGADAAPASFPVAVCEAALPRGATEASVAGRVLPMPRQAPQRVLVIGDTGCRMKQGAPWQACNDARAWPFAAIAARAAGMAPDLVIHVGDYHYRESPCPEGIAACAGSAFGYGWAAWRADFFAPAAPLLAAAPWVMLRGNHEECRRAGQGWYRFLDPRPWRQGEVCDDAANDRRANHGDPYAVDLGRGTQLVVFDSAAAGMRALAADDSRRAAYTSEFEKVAALAARPGIRTTWFASHHPVLAFIPEPGDDRPSGNPALQSVMSALFGPAWYPPGISLALHGHAHSFQAIDFASEHPAALVSGNAGDMLDEALPPMAGLTPAPGTQIARMTHGDHFGFAMLERRGDADSNDEWQANVYDMDGRLLTRCALGGRRLACDRAGPLQR